ncbi:hypothetical protein BH23CHL1_BH23CHL1_24410 [soil metagenome]
MNIVRSPTQTVMNGRSTNGRTTSTGNFNCELIYAAGDTIGIPARAEDREVAQPGVDPIGSKSWAAKRLQGCAVNLADTAATLALKMVVLAGANSNRQLKAGGTVMWRGNIFGNTAGFEKRMPHQLNISKRFSLATVLSMAPYTCCATSAPAPSSWTPAGSPSTLRRRRSFTTRNCWSSMGWSCHSLLLGALHTVP